ncbi:MAG TPA: carbon storage regulator [Thermodesulforhabdus norvegica]|uniref:Translational regulator CsrA n=1 Tax=Thermodesulforhabdus norvegica TaxID=39841 RepID=A0A7C0WR65_9BACT|nr:carbon storage regulator CsrA [Deltaproteobacteria bacterium]MBW2068308.1 carbon storage regulator CsrA [Deltaproteobacteria bacterium]HDL89314.1 carbon storage regulator [Thermodesulforhabdus norvegica]
MGFLVLSRKEGESIRIGDSIQIVVTEIGPNRVKLGIKSPRSIPVYREELYQKIQEENRKAAQITNVVLDEAGHFLRKWEILKNMEK